MVHIPKESKAKPYPRKKKSNYEMSEKSQVLIRKEKPLPKAEHQLGRRIDTE